MNKTKSEIITILKEQGVRIIPVELKGKKPAVLDFQKYLTGEKVFDGEITPEQNYGVICGQISDNLAVIDVEKIDPVYHWNKNKEPKHIPLEEEFINQIIPDCLNETFTTRTGSQNYHILVKLEKSTPKTKKFTYLKDNQNIYNIDFKVTGHCVEAGSVHPNGKNYELVSNTTRIKKIGLDSILAHLENIGFKSSSKLNDKSQNDFNTWTIDQLENEPWVRGERRRKQISLYCKLRRQKQPIRKTKELISQINAKQEELLDKNELEYNFKTAENYFQNTVLPQYGYEYSKVTRPQNNPDMIRFIDDFIEEYDLITLPNSNETYYRDGVIHRQGIDGILKERLREIIIQRNYYNDLKFNIAIRSQLPMREPNPFDNNLIGLQNVVLDPNTFEPIPDTVYVNSFLPRKYRPELRDLEDKILTTIKQILGDQHDKFLAICVIALTGVNNVRKMIIFDGAPDSGKTTLLMILQWFVGIFTATNIKKLQQDTRLLAKCTARLNLSDEAENCISDPDIFKQIIDGTVQQNAWKYETELTTYDPSKVLHVGGANGIPDIEGESGIAKRIVRIPCRNHFEKNDELLKTLMTADNLDRFLLTVIDYAKSHVKNPLLNMSTEEKTEMFWILGDPIRHFKENYMYESEGEFCLPRDVYDEFMKFCKEKDISKQFSPAKFARALGIASKSKRVNGCPVKTYHGWNLIGKSSTNQTI